MDTKQVILELRTQKGGTMSRKRTHKIDKF